MLSCIASPLFVLGLDYLREISRALKYKFLPILEHALGTRVALLEFTAFVDLIIRCIVCKPWPRIETRSTLSVDKVSPEKIQALGAHGAKVVDLKHPTLGFAQAVRFAL